MIAGTIAILEYGTGNVSSIKNMLRRCNVEAIIADDLEVIANASAYVLPGVGSFDHGIKNLRNAPFFRILEDRVLTEKVPILGVCLGAQLLAKSSEEGSLPGLGWIDAKVVKFDTGKMNQAKLKVPHMGWTDVRPAKTSPLLNGIEDPRFYFVHSYHLVCNDVSDVLLTANYGYDFVAAVARDNIMGVQFHPEKSHRYGMKLYENFVKNIDAKV